MTIQELYSQIGGNYDQAVRVMRSDRLIDKYVRKFEASGVGQTLKLNAAITKGTMTQCAYSSSDESIVTVDQDGENLIELFYSRVDDQRVETNAQVDHVYTLYTYELNADGKYELTAHDPVKEEKV